LKRVIKLCALKTFLTSNCFTLSDSCRTARATYGQAAERNPNVGRDSLLWDPSWSSKSSKNCWPWAWPTPNLSCSPEAGTWWKKKCSPNRRIPLWLDTLLTDRIQNRLRSTVVNWIWNIYKGRRKTLTLYFNPLLNWNYTSFTSYNSTQQRIGTGTSITQLSSHSLMCWK